MAEGSRVTEHNEDGAQERNDGACGVDTERGTRHDALILQVAVGKRGGTVGVRLVWGLVMRYGSWVSTQGEAEVYNWKEIMLRWLLGGGRSGAFLAEVEGKYPRG